MIIAKPGDLVGLFATKNNKFRVGLFLDESRIVVLYERGLGAKNEHLDHLARHCHDSESLGLFEPKDDVISFQDNMQGEVYKLNIFAIAKEFNRPPTAYIDIVKHNLNQLDKFEVGDIIKFEGYRVLDAYVLYHHYSVFTDEDKCKNVHKSGEPALGSLRFALSIVNEDNLLELASFRKIYKETTFEGIYPPKEPSEIVASAKTRVGEKRYDLLLDNCQHFATNCRYGKSRSLEVEQTAGFFASLAVGAAIFFGIALKLFSSSNKTIDSRTTDEEEDNENQKSSRQKSSKIKSSNRF